MAETMKIPVVSQGGKLKAILPEARIRTKRNGNRIYPDPPVSRSAEFTPPIFAFEETAGYQWAPWGNNDRLPTTVRQKIESVPMAAQAIHKLMLMMNGNGIAYYRNRDLQQGESKIKRAYIPEVENFLRRNRIKTHYLPAQFLDYRYYTNTFSELILSADKKQITNIYHKEAEFSRLSIQDEITGRINHLYYSPRFANGYRPTNDEIIAIEMMDHWNDLDFIENLRGFKFAWHSKLPSPGVQYYARMPWLGLFKEDGWLDVSASVPKIISTMQQQQVVLKYHILIPESYFDVRYPEWNTYNARQRERLIDDLIDTINETLSGTDDVYKSIATIFRDTASGQALGKIEVVAVDDKMKNDQWVPSSETADAQIVQGLGLHPSQLGLAPQGGKMGAGSGSDQREGYNTAITLNTLEQEIVLESLQYVADYNAMTNPDWDITFFIAHTHHTTTNNQESGLLPDENTIIAE